MKGMNFTQLLQQKIEERREGRSAAVLAAAEADARFRTRVAPLVEAVANLAKTLSTDTMFAALMGRPEVEFRREDEDGYEGTVRLSGRFAALSFNVMRRGGVLLRIQPGTIVMTALDCGLSYETGPIKGDWDRIDDLMACACDHMADFIADIYLSPVAHILQPGTQGRGDAEL
jgi:hypothetical protein